MGYSARYHAASLAAVFLALAIGILIGVGFGEDVVEGTQKNLEQSLEGDLEEARNQAEELQGELSRSDEFAEQVFPALVADRLAGQRIGLLALGDLDNDLAADIEEALAPTGARLVEVAVLREPPDLESLGEKLQRTRFSGLELDSEAQEELGKGVGRQLILGGTLLERIRSQLLSRASGSFGPVDGLVVARRQPQGMSPEDASATSRLESAILDGASATATPIVGVERSDDEVSSIGFFPNDLATVDDADQFAGKVAIVFALLGADGNFGVKDTADRLLPDLLVPTPAQPATGVELEQSQPTPAPQPRRGTRGTSRRDRR